MRHNNCKQASKIVYCETKIMILLTTYFNKPLINSLLCPNSTLIKKSLKLYLKFVKLEDKISFFEEAFESEWDSLVVESPSEW